MNSGFLPSVTQTVCEKMLTKHVYDQTAQDNGIQGLELYNSPVLSANFFSFCFTFYQTQKHCFAQEFTLVDNLLSLTA